MEATTNSSKIDMTSADGLKRLLLQQKTTKARFRLMMTQEQAVTLLKAAYRAEVESREREFCETLLLEECIAQVAGILIRPSYKFGLMLCGESGNGKTTMVYALKSAMAFAAQNGLCTDPMAFLTVADAVEIARAVSDENKFREIKNLKYLVIEDLGREPAEVVSYGNLYYPLTELIEFRYARQMFTVITSNLMAKQFRDKYGQRIADRFNEMLEVVTFKDKSFRK